MVARFNEKYQKDLFRVSPEAVAALEAFPWPGNIRQLENVITQAVLVSTGPELRREHLPPLIRQHAAPPPAPPLAPVPAGSLAESRGDHERGIIEQALAEAKNCRSRAAVALGVSRVTLYNKMKKYGIAKLRV